MSAVAMQSVLRTSRLVLRPVVPDDADQVTALLQDWDIVRRLSRVPWPYKCEHALAWLGACQAGKDDMIMAICKDEQLIGVIGVHDFDPMPEFGYWLAQSCWGQGYMSEAARAVLAHVFAAGRANRLKSGYFADNPASGRVLAKLGFTVTGQGGRHCLALGREVAHIDMVLTRARFAELTS